MSIRIPMLTACSEHVYVAHCLTREKVAQALVTLHMYYVHADSNWADILTMVVPYLILELV